MPIQRLDLRTLPKGAPESLDDMLRFIRYMAEHIGLPMLKLDLKKEDGESPLLVVDDGACDIMLVEVEVVPAGTVRRNWYVQYAVPIAATRDEPEDVDIVDVYEGPDALDAAKVALNITVLRNAESLLESISDEWYARAMESSHA